MKKISVFLTVAFFTVFSVTALDINIELNTYSRYSDTLDYLSDQAFSIDDQTSDEYLEIYYSAHFVKDRLEEKTNILKKAITSNPENTLEKFIKFSNTRNSNISKFRELIQFNIEIIRDSGNIELLEAAEKIESQLNTVSRSSRRAMPDMQILEEIEEIFHSEPDYSRSIDSSKGMWKIVMTGKNKTTPFLVQSDSFLKAGEIILTFDDGPTTINNRTASVTEVLNSFRYPSIFFVLGKSITSNTAPLLEMQKEFADVSVHGMHHATPSGSPFTAMSRNEILSDLTKVKDKIYSVTNKTAHYFRPPYGVIRKADLDAIMSDLNLIPVGWTIDSLDWSTKNPDELFEKMKSLIKKRGKGILLMHDIHEQSALSFARLAEWLNDNNYKIVNPDRIIKAYNETQSNTIAPVKPSIPVNTNSGSYVYINVSMANIRKGPGKDYDVVTTLPENTKLRILEEINDSDGIIWYRVEAVSEGITGYISSRIVK